MFLLRDREYRKEERAQYGKPIARFLWVSLAFYAVSFIPQLVSNYRRKSIHGLSILTIFTNFFSYVYASMYAHLLYLPAALRVMLPLGAVASGCLVVQSLWYEPSSRRRNQALFVYAVALFVTAFIVVSGLDDPHYYGNLAGWNSSVLWFTYNIPQLWKFYKRKSVKGFNFLVAAMCMSGALAECIAAVCLGLPTQTLINGSISFTFGLLYVYKFALYCKRPWYRWAEIPTI